MTEAMTTADVMQALKIKDPVTIHRLAASGRLPGVKIGKRWRFEQATVERFLRGEDLRRPTAQATPPRPKIPRGFGIPTVKNPMLK